jgi:sec-independent protein translocase protein TatB
MFDVGYSELLLIAIVALVVIGPKDLPRVMRTVGLWVGKARGMARHFKAGVDTMMREAELEEMEKKWREENERIMKDHPLVGFDAETLLPGAGSDVAADGSAPAPGDTPVASDAAAPEAKSAPPELP